MRKVLFFTTVLMFVFTSSIWAADISGTWTLTMSGRQGDVSMDLNIKASEDGYTITANNPTLGDMEGTGKLEGNDVTMNLTATGEMKIGFVFTGTVSGNKMSGTREVSMAGGGRGGQAEGGEGGQGGRGGEGGQGGQQGGQAPGGQQGGQAPGGGEGGEGAQGGRGGEGGQQGGGQSMSNEWTAVKK